MRETLVGGELYDRRLATTAVADVIDPVIGRRALHCRQLLRRTGEIVRPRFHRPTLVHGGDAAHDSDVRRARLAVLAMAIALCAESCGARTGLDVRGGADGGTDAGPVVRLTDAVAISAGDLSACALTSHDDVWCWGWRFGATSPVAHVTPMFDAQPQLRFDRLTAVAISVGYTSACLRSEDGRVSCWGENCAGQLATTSDEAGLGTERLTDVVGVDDAIDVDVGGAHACIVRGDGSVWCWGAGEQGQLGDGTFAATPVWPVAADDCRSSPLGGHPSRPVNGRATVVAVVGIPAAVRVTAGWSHTCAVTRTGDVWCWGSNEHGQLGTGDTTNSSVPVHVEGIGAISQVTAGSAVTCARDGSGEVWCWGEGVLVGVGGGVGAPAQLRPVSVGLHDTTHIDAGGDQVCALPRGDTAWTWGPGVLGRVTTRSTDWTVPERVQACPMPHCEPAPLAADVACGGAFGCLIGLDGVVSCWGDDLWGRLGDGRGDGMGSGNESDFAAPVAGPLGGH